jgi:hypothetical protein
VLKEAKKRLALDLSQVKLDALEDKNRRLQIETDEAEERKNNQLIISTQEKLGHESMVKDYLARMAQLNTRLEVESKEKDQMSAEWMVRLKQEVDAAWEQSNALSNSKIARLEEIHDVNSKETVRHFQERGIRGLEVETLKWQKTIQEREKHFVSEISQIRIDAREERDREVQHERLQVERTQLSSLQEELDLIQARLKITQDELVAQLNKAAESNKTIDMEKSLRKLHEETLKECRLELDHLRTTLKSSSSLRNDEKEMAEQRIRMLRAAWQEDLEDQLQRNDKIKDDYLILQINELEADRARGMKLEASKWKQAMKETEKRLALEINQAKLEARDERDQELQSDIAGWEGKTQRAVQVVEDRHKLILQEMLEEQERNTSKLIFGLKREKEEAVLYAEKALKEQLSEDWMERMKMEVDNAWNQASVQSKLKLVKQQEVLEDFKRDVTIQGQRFATERNELQERSVFLSYYHTNMMYYHSFV